MKHLIAFVLLAVGTVPAFAQPAADEDAYAEAGRPLLRNYSPMEYNAAPQSWAIAQDHRGVMYFGNDAGLLEYDGVTWHLTSMPGDPVVRSLAIDETGTLYAGSFGDFGYFKPDRQGLHFTSLRTHIPEQARDFVDVWKTHATPGGTYFQTESYLFRWDGETIDVWHPSREFGFSWTSFFVRGRLYVQDMDRGLLTLADDSLRPVRGVEPLAEHRITVMVPFGEDRILIGTERAGLYLYDGTVTTPFAPEASAYLATQRLFSGIALPDGTFGFNTLEGGVIRCDDTGRLLQRIDKSTGLKNQSIFAAYVDRQRGLWLASENGLARVEIDTPLHFFDDEDLTGSVLAIRRYAGTLYVGTSLGLFALRPARSPLERPVFLGIDALRNISVWSFVEAQGMLLAATDEGVFQIQGTRADQVDASWALAMIRTESDDRLLFVGLANGLLRLRYQTDRQAWVSAGRVEAINTSIYNLIEETPGILWIGTSSSGLIRLAFNHDYLAEPDSTHYDTEDGLPEGEVNVTKMGGVLRFETANGLYRYDPMREPPFIPDTTFQTVPPSQVHSLMTEDRSGASWAMLDEGPGLLRRRAGTDTYDWVHADLSRRLSVWNPSTIYDDEASDVVWFGALEGLVRYDAGREHTFAPAPATLLRQVTFKDSLLFRGTSPEAFEAPVINYSSSTLRFSYAAPDYDAPDRTRYQVFLDGFDDTWSAWSAETQKDYTNLPGGDYVFRVRARNVYGMESEDATFPFTILPPWYRTGWAYAIYAFLALGLLYGGARAWNWRLEQKNRRLEAVIAERTHEINRKNEENERLLLNILPGPIAERLKHSDEPIADAFPDVTVLFADLVGFTALSQHTPPAGLVALLNDLFSDFDALALEHGVEKIKTIGDAYMAVCGLPEERPDHAEAMAAMALDMIDALDRFNAAHGTLLDMRVGINTGPVVAGVIGTHKFIYDLWGDTVNTAARMESHGVPGRVHITAATYERLKTAFVLEARGAIEIKGKHLMHTYLLRRSLPGLQATTSQPSVLSSETPS